MKKYLMGFTILIFMFMFFSIDVEAANKVIFESENNNYSLELLVDKDDVKFDKKDIKEYEDFFNIKIKDNKDNYSILKEYEDFIQIDPEAFSKDVNDLCKGMLKNENIVFKLEEEVVSLLYSGIRIFKIKVDGISEDLEFNINIDNHYISFYKTVEEFNDAELNGYNSLKFKLNNDLKEFIIQAIDYSNIKDAKITSTIDKNEIVSNFRISYKENVSPLILNAAGSILNLKNFTVDENTYTVSFDIVYDELNYFSAFHYIDLYNYLGIVSIIEVKESGVYSKEKEFNFIFSELEGIENITYELINNNGNVKTKKGEIIDKTSNSIILDANKEDSITLSVTDTNTYGIVVTILVTFMFSILFIFAFILYKRSK